MKVNLCYSKIPHFTKARNKGVLEGQCVAFEKYDGTNMHWLSPVACRGFDAFGTRRNQFALTSLGQVEFHTYNSGRLQHAPVLFQNVAPLLRIPEDIEITLFTEYFGPGSFNGQHSKTALQKEFRLMLIDIEHNGTLLTPDPFLEMAAEIGWPTEDIAQVVWRGKAKHCGAFLQDVRAGVFDVEEGVVLKTPRGMFKTKTDAWEQKIATARAT